jgi:regulator of protease activity HflC (stomatin/prohibitin superfamily)
VWVVSERVVSLETLKEDRECVVREALGEADDSVRRLEAKADAVRRRLATVPTEIQNLVGVLKQIGGSRLASVQEEMAALSVSSH